LSSGKMNSERTASTTPPLIRSFPSLLSRWVAHRSNPTNRMEMYASLEISITVELMVVRSVVVKLTNCCAICWSVVPKSGGG